MSRAIEISGLSETEVVALDGFLEALDLAPRDKAPAGDLNHYLQFLRARKFDAKASAKMFKSCLEWRKLGKVDTVLDAPCDKESIWARVQPHAYPGFDKDGRPIYIEKIGIAHFPTITGVLSPEDLNLIHIRQMERLVRMCRESTEKTGKYVENFTCIFDLKGLNMSHRHGLKFIQACAAIDQDNYPERMGKLFVVNAPRLFPFFWKICSRWVDEKTRSKINVLSSKSRDEKLLAQIPSHFLPKEYGGTAPDIEVADLKEVQQFLKYSTDMYDSKAHDTVAVGARSMKVVSLEAPRAHTGTRFEWNFGCVNKNVSFSVVIAGCDCKTKTIKSSARSGASIALALAENGNEEANNGTFDVPVELVAGLGASKAAVVVCGSGVKRHQGCFILEKGQKATLHLVLNNEYSMLTGKEVRVLLKALPYEPTPTSSVNSRSWTPSD